MLTKILFTGLVIVIVLVMARARARHLTLREVGGFVRPAGSRPRVVAYLLAAALMLAAVLGYLHFWSSWHEPVKVRVTDTQTGQTVSYEAHRGSIDKREFQTTDGWKVKVSDGERVEIEQR